MIHALRQRFLGDEQSRFTSGVVLAALLLVAPFLLGPVKTAVLIEVLLFAIFATAFNLLYGYTGLLSFGHAMFVAVSAYAAAKFFRTIGPALGFDQLFGGVSVLMTFAGAIVTGVVLATVLAVLVGYLSVKLEEIYFAMITLSFSMAIYVVINQDISGQVGELLGLGGLLATNGSDGLTIPYSATGQVDLFGFSFQLMNITSYNTFYFIVLLFFAGAMYTIWRITRSPFGEVCTAIRENPERARALGIDVTRHSWATFVISGAFSGLMGALYAPLLSNVSPGLAYWSFSAEPVIMTVIGGPYSFLGPLAGSFLYEVLRWFISQVPALEAHWQLVFGFILLLAVLFFENGAAGGLERLRARLFGEDGEETGE
ncbi:branched-chain amino acid ABC transporter permease [Halospeciosus flavus]|uniref:Branched-chain amino acid ABC transporter permease n=1 Tax=Halospeciosus flavus TaxID=3032283 RepID=A0ABD5Z8G4_9EURY|nr:branched-chain amino acid ABC transporter permease [Halospeciosus flavus]